MALTQLLKWCGLPSKPAFLAPLVVLAVSALGVWVWAVSYPNQATPFDLGAGWIVVATSAAGVFGFTRAASESVTSASSRPHSSDTPKG